MIKYNFHFCGAFEVLALLCCLFLSATFEACGETAYRHKREYDLLPNNPTDWNSVHWDQICVLLDGQDVSLGGNCTRAWRVAHEHW